MRRARAGLLLFGALTLVGATQAAHVTDKLAVGLYSSPGEETPERVLTSGMPLEILDRGGRFCKVRLGDGDSGWVECRYVTDEKPALAMLLEAQARTSGLLERVEELERQLDEKKLSLQDLELRLRAAERIVAAQGAGTVEQESGTAADSAIAEESEQPPNDPWAEWDLERVLLALSGAAGGLVLGALLLYWRCRRRFGGLRI